MRNASRHAGHGNARVGGRLLGGVLAAVMGMGVCAAVFADDETLQDLLSTAKTTSQPAEVKEVTSQPSTQAADALGTIKQKTPAGARIGLVTLNNKTKYEGRVWTTLQTPFRVWVEESKVYRDVDLALIKKVDVKVNSATMEPDWRWLKEGSDVKIYSGKKYPMVDLAYTFTLMNDQVISGTVVAPVYVFDGSKRHTLALYKKYKGPLDETLENVVYIQSIVLRESDVVAAANEKLTRKLPLLD